jgi:outer membrane lipoprotein-sorting protein
VARLSARRRGGGSGITATHSGGMTSVLTSRRLRWAVPGLAAAAVAAAAITMTTGGGASAHPNLPPRTAAQLLAQVEQAHPASMSGTIVETARLGLPSLPSAGDAGGGNSLSLQGFLAGSHTMRMWYAGPDRQRLALLAPLSERDVIHNGTNLWTYTSTTNEVTHSTVGREARNAGPEKVGPTPQQAAEQALRAVDPTTRVSVDATARVAGRSAYQLDLTPRDTRSLIGSVRIAIDSQTSVPLRVQVFAKHVSTPAIQVGFTDVSFGTVSASIFNFVPPAGAKVVKGNALAELATGSGGASGSDSRPSMTPRDGHASTGHKILGNGWTAVAEFSTGGQSFHSMGDLLSSASTAVPAGRLITSSLLSVLITNDGHIFVGPVSGSAIQRVAATGHGL